MDARSSGIASRAAASGSTGSGGGRRRQSRVRLSAIWKSQVENRRNYSALHADGDGVITEVRVERGQVVAEGQIVVRLAHHGAREAVIEIPETQLARTANHARASAFGDSEHVVDATLRELSAAADPVTRTFRARFRAPGSRSSGAGG